MMHDDGLRIVLTPTQLAAVLTGGSLDGRSSNWTRAWGGLKLVFGGLEELGAGALLLAPEPTMLTKVAGVGLGVHGADTLQSGARQAWTGRDTPTLTSEGTAALAAALGVSEDRAREIGEGVDAAVPIVLTLGAAAARLAAVRGGRIVLAEHEAATLKGVGGHTLAKHIAKTDAELAQRLAAGQAPAVSTFLSLAEAEQAISINMRANRAAIIAWAKTAGTSGISSVKEFDLVIAKGVGKVLVRGASTPTIGASVRVVLKKEAFNGKLYYILTAYPLP